MRLHILTVTTALLLAAATTASAAPPPDEDDLRFGSPLVDPSEPREPKPPSESEPTKVEEPPLPTPIARIDRLFVLAANYGGNAEVSLSELAVARGTAPSVLTFAKHMIDVHGKSNKDLATVVNARGMTLPTDKPAAFVAAHTRLSIIAIGNFDRAYMDIMVKNHKKALSLFRKQAASSKDDQLRAFAADRVTTIRLHLQAAQAIQADLRRNIMTTDVSAMLMRSQAGKDSLMKPSTVDESHPHTDSPTPKPSQPPLAPQQLKKSPY